MFCYNISKDTLSVINMKIILISGKSRHGKDTTADILQNINENDNKASRIIHFADGVKKMARERFSWNGEKDKIGIDLLQWIGSKMREESLSFWVDNAILPEITFEQYEFLIIPDWRYPDEASRVQEICSKTNNEVLLFRVVRPNFISPLTIEQQNHSMETSLDNYQNFDFKFINNGDINNLKEQIEKYFNSTTYE